MDKHKNKNNYCESCYHVMKEMGMLFEDDDYDCFSIACDIQQEAGDICLNCGQNLTDIVDKDSAEKDINLLDSALENKNLKVICYTAPSIRVSLGDEFGLEAGTNVEGKMVSALKKLGFYAVFDMNTAADFTILEEAEEFKKRLLAKERLPMFTSCCPGWVNYCTKVAKDFIPNLSTCKSPQQMFGALINNYYAERLAVKPTDIFVVSIVPCLAKKLELKQDNINSNVGFDVDLAITTREIATLMKKKGISLEKMQDQNFDNFFGAASGAGAIFGNTGGVMEAVLRTVNDTLSKKEKKELEYNMVRGLDGIRRAEIKIEDRVLKVAIVTGLKNVNIILNELRQEPNKYDFVEIMACEGGCIGGAGQPYAKGQPLDELLKKRAQGLYKVELKKEYRKAHKNPAVMQVYNDYLGTIGGEKAKKLLHRDY